MTIYTFYRIRNALGELTKDPELYAYTTNKKIRDVFISERNMNVFYLVRRNISSEFYKRFGERYKNRELSYQKMYTRNPYNPVDKSTIKVLTNWNEVDKIITKTDVIFTELMKYVNPGLCYLKKEYIKDLEDLYYTTVCKFAKPKLTSSIYDGFEDYSEENFIFQSNLDYDEFALYMYFVAYTYNK